MSNAAIQVSAESPTPAELAHYDGEMVAVLHALIALRRDKGCACPRNGPDCPARSPTRSTTSSK